VPTLRPRAWTTVQLLSPRFRPRQIKRSPETDAFFYAELVSQMTDLAGQQFNSGDSGQASETLNLVRKYAEKINMCVADDSKKLRDSELLMQRTSFRLKGMLNKVSYEDRPALEATLKQLNQTQTQLMMRVFKK
jgi:hypothetical protein